MKKKIKLPALVATVDKRVRAEREFTSDLGWMVLIRRKTGDLEKLPLTPELLGDKNLIIAAAVQEILKGGVAEVAISFPVVLNSGEKQEMGYQIIYERLALRNDFIAVLHKPTGGLGKFEKVGEVKYVPEFEAFDEEADDGRFKTLFGMAAKFALEDMEV